MHETFKETLRKSETALRSLLMGVGTSVDETTRAPISCCPVELISGIPPSQWLYGAAFNLAEIKGHSARIRGEAANSQAEQGQLEDWPTFWAELTDLRFHISCFLLYAEEVRGMIMMGLSHDDCHLLRPDLRDLACSGAPGSEVGLGGRAAGFDAATVESVTKDLQDVRSGCAVADDAINDLLSEPQGHFRVLAKRFANVHAASAALGLTLLRADVVSCSMMAHSPEQDDVSDI